ncbi:MAG: hypothetical protein ACE5DL_05640 [Nitrosopumilaceae archaeon]
MNHEVDVSNLMFNKTSEKSIFKKYDINVDLEEESSDDEKTVLKYSLDLTSNPKNSVINISGNTILTGERTEVEEFLKQENEKTPEIVSLIYQELFPLMYIISKNMKIPSPSHTLSQNNVKEYLEQNQNSELNDEPQNKVNSKNNEKTTVPDTQLKEQSENTSTEIQEEKISNEGMENEESKSESQLNANEAQNNTSNN